MRHIANDHIKTIIITNTNVYREINSRIKILLKSPSPKNRAAIEELRKLRAAIGQSIDCIF
jgi:hypothetical protein